MRAMIFAAGLGTRLGQITEKTPKCLVEAGGKPLLEHVINRLKLVGVNQIIINLFHLGDQIENFIRSNGSFGINIEFSREDQLLGTGGGLLKAEWFFKDSEHFIVHNGDIYSEIDLSKALNNHKKFDPLATLVVMRRSTSRVLLFNKNFELQGWANRKTGEIECIGKPNDYEELAFSGIQILSNKIFNYMRNQELSFSTIRVFMNAIRSGATIRSYLTENEYWIDIGRPDTLQELRERLSNLQ